MEVIRNCKKGELEQRRKTASKGSDTKWLEFCHKIKMDPQKFDPPTPVILWKPYILHPLLVRVVLLHPSWSESSIKRLRIQVELQQGGWFSIHCKTCYTKFIYTVIWMGVQIFQGFKYYVTGSVRRTVILLELTCLVKHILQSHKKCHHACIDALTEGRYI